MTNDNKTAYIVNRRSDGKYKVTYVFPLSGTRIVKIRTSAQIEADRLNGYTVVGFYDGAYSIASELDADQYDAEFRAQNR